MRVVVASVDTYLRYAEACNRMDLEAGPRKPVGLPEIVGGQLAGSGSQAKTKGALSGAAEAIADAFQQARDEGRERETVRPRHRRDEER